MKPKQKISRSQKPSKNLYFSPEQDKAIVEYQQSSNEKEKNKIYQERIHPSFVKLVENLISIYKFNSLGDSYEDLRSDCISFLFETLGKFDATRGSRAFSYFNVVAKRWLIIRSKSSNQSAKRQISMDDSESLTAHEVFLVNQADIYEPVDNLTKQEDEKSIPDMLSDLEKLARTQNEKTVLASIKEIFDNVDDIEFLNKSAVLVYMRELSEMNPKQMTSSMQNIKKYYRLLRAEKNNNG